MRRKQCEGQSIAPRLQGEGQAGIEAPQPAPDVCCQFLRIAIGAHDQIGQVSSRVNAIEAINGGSLDGPRFGIPFWQDKLNKGFRLTAIGGSDNHDADYCPSIRSAVGHPTHGRGNPERHPRGHVFIDLEGTPDHTLEFSQMPAQRPHRWATP